MMQPGLPTKRSTREVTTSVRCATEARGGAQPVSFTEAVAHGLAPDGGLYLPEEFPDLSPYIEPWRIFPIRNYALSF